MAQKRDKELKTVKDIIKYRDAMRNLPCKNLFQIKEKHYTEQEIQDILENNRKKICNTMNAFRRDNNYKEWFDSTWILKELNRTSIVAGDLQKIDNVIHMRRRIEKLKRDLLSCKKDVEYYLYFEFYTTEQAKDTILGPSLKILEDELKNVQKEIDKYFSEIVNDFVKTLPKDYQTAIQRGGKDK